MNRIALFFILSIFILSCAENKPKTEILDLMKYGLPIQIKAPAEAVVKADDMGFYTDVTVKGGDDYFIQILSTSATTSDIGILKKDQLNEVEKNPYFKRITFEETNGFIFEKQIDSLYNYDFRYVKIQGSNEYIFQTGLFGKFSEDAVRKMYDSVK